MPWYEEGPTYSGREEGVYSDVTPTQLDSGVELAVLFDAILTALLAFCRTLASIRGITSRTIFGSAGAGACICASDPLG